MVHASHPKPDQVDAAFLQVCTDSEESLRGRDLFKSAQPLIVFDHFTVRKVHLAGSQNWAEVEIDELLSLTGGKADVHKRSERQRWPLIRRDKATWELVPPRSTIYLPQHIAARILSQQLAHLTEEHPGPRLSLRRKTRPNWRDCWMHFCKSSRAADQICSGVSGSGSRTGAFASLIGTQA